jgi:hypothetical protein
MAENQEPRPKRRFKDTSAYSDAAENLVTVMLTLEGLTAVKAPPGRHGYDVLVFGTNGKQLRIQVKSRYQTDYDGGFPLRNTTSDFVVFVALNREDQSLPPTPRKDAGRKAPEFFVFPTSVLVDAKRPNNSWHKVFLRHVPKVEQYRNAWSLIMDAASGQGNNGTTKGA